MTNEKTLNPYSRRLLSKFEFKTLRGMRVKKKELKEESLDIIFFCLQGRLFLPKGVTWEINKYIFYAKCPFSLIPFLLLFDSSASSSSSDTSVPLFLFLFFHVLLHFLFLTLLQCLCLLFFVLFLFILFLLPPPSLLHRRLFSFSSALHLPLFVPLGSFFFILASCTQFLCLVLFVFHSRFCFGCFPLFYCFIWDMGISLQVEFSWYKCCY